MFSKLGAKFAPKNEIPSCTGYRAAVLHKVVAEVVAADVRITKLVLLGAKLTESFAKSQLIELLLLLAAKNSCSVRKVRSVESINTNWIRASTATSGLPSLKISIDCQKFA